MSTNSNSLSNIFANIKRYNTPWIEDPENPARPLNEQELGEIKSCIIVEGTYSLACKLSFNDNTIGYIPIDEDRSSLGAGDTPDPTSLILVTLIKKGEKPILRIR
jgi:hypothetical protein